MNRNRPLLSFVLVFIAEFIRFSGDMSLCAVSTYLIVVLLTDGLSTAGWFKTTRNTACTSSAVILRQLRPLSLKKRQS